jgi:hypothetical protein
VTFLLNYLYVVIKNNEILSSISEKRDIMLLREVFHACLDPYLQILSDWVSHGDLKDPREEFFIKENLQLDMKTSEAAS